MESSENLDALVATLEAGDGAGKAAALEAVAKTKGRGATKALTDFLRTAPVGLLATRAAMALENRKHRSCLPALYEIYEARPELAEDIIPIFSTLEDPDAVPLVVPGLRQLMAGPARLSTLTFLLKCADPEALADILLPALVIDPVPAARDDIVWALEEILLGADEATLEHIGETAREIGPTALTIVEPYLPTKSELELQAPQIAASLLTELERQELIELTPGAPDALVEMLAGAICEARSPKGLIRDVERILMDSTAIEEVYADRDDLRKAFQKITQ